MALHHIHGEQSRAHIFLDYSYDDETDEIVVSEIEIHSGRLKSQTRIARTDAPAKIQQEMQKLGF